MNNYQEIATKLAEVKELLRKSESNNTDISDWCIRKLERIEEAIYE